MQNSSVDVVKGRCSSGELSHLDGTAVDPLPDGFLQTVNGEMLYAIRSGIVVLLPELAITGVSGRAAHAGRFTDPKTLGVMHFYDRIGWTTASGGVFVDAAINEDFRNVSRRYIRDCHLRVNRHLPASGPYLVDIASGPIQYDEYLTYSDRFATRICCDISFEALRLAQRKLGTKGLYIQCDITNIPLKDDVADAFVSLHTIYHVPAERQLDAFRELERVTRPGGSGVVVYSWGYRAPAMSALAAIQRSVSAVARAGRSLLRALAPAWLLARRRSRRAAGGEAAALAVESSASQICFHAHRFAWYRTNLAATGNWSLHAWRFVSTDVLKQYVGNGALGRLALSALFRLEERMPALLGRFGQYPMFVFRKPVANH